MVRGRGIFVECRGNVVGTGKSEGAIKAKGGRDKDPLPQSANPPKSFLITRRQSCLIRKAL
jgi:hypothetical protein